MNENYVESDFNMAVSTLNRINSLLAEYNSYDDSFFEQRFEVLKRLYEEVYPFEHEKNHNSVKEYDNLINDIESDLNDFKIKREDSKRFNRTFVYKKSLNKNMIDLSKKIRVALYVHKLLIKIGKDPKKAILL